MKTDWPENEKVGKLLFQLQELNISIGWLIQELYYAEKKGGIHHPEQYIEHVLNKIQKIFRSYEKRIEEI